MSSETDLPDFLHDVEAFRVHLASALEDDTGAAKGDSFLHLARLAVPLFDETRSFGPLTPSEKQTHDRGVDLLSDDPATDRRLYCQAKYRIPGVESLDGIVSKFENYEMEMLDEPGTIPGLLGNDATPPHFAIATTADLQRILPKYEQSAHSSVTFYKRLVREQRLYVFDGARLLRKFQELWKRTYVIPTDITLHAEGEWVVSGTVAVGIVKARQLVDLYEDHGDSIFFENIREYLGHESDVNNRIRQTMMEEPERLLERNNGVTFRAKRFTQVPGDESSLRLSSGAIVNGCQTTMSAVEALRRLGGESAAFDEHCLVQVKVVGVEDAWAVASAANYQNTVHRIDLELAKWLRPQLVRKAAAEEGLAITSRGSEDSPVATVSELLQTFYSREIRHEQVRYLFLGIFGTAPNELFNNNYERIKLDVINGIYGGGDQAVDTLYKTLFQIADACDQALGYCEDRFSDETFHSVFRRFHTPKSPYYAAYMALLALAVGVDVDLGERLKSTEDDVKRTSEFLDRSRDLLTNNFPRFRSCFAAVYVALGQLVLEVTDDQDVLQVMNRKIRDAGFTTLLQRAKLQINLLDSASDNAT